MLLDTPISYQASAQPSKNAGPSVVKQDPYEAGQSRLLLAQRSLNKL